MSIPPDPTADPAAAVAAAEAAQQHVAAALSAAALVATNNNDTHNDASSGGVFSPSSIPQHGLPIAEPLHLAHVAQVPQTPQSPQPIDPAPVPQMEVPGIVSTGLATGLVAASSPAHTPAPEAAHDPSLVATQAQAPPKLEPAPPPPSPPLSVRIYSPASHAHLVLYLAALHGSCITHDGLSGTFTPPLNHVKLLEWWKARLNPAPAASATSSTALPPATVFLLLANNTAAKVAGTDLVGAAMVRPHVAETSPHVAVVELLLVNPRFREGDGLRLLLEAVEQHVVMQGKVLLTAETDADSPAAKDFLRLGFAEAGRIPGFVVRPSTSQIRDQAILYKTLATL